MAPLDCLYLLLIVCINLALSATNNDYDEVVTLTDSSFDDTVSGIWMIKFYAPWCGHCKKYAPIYSKTAKITSSSNGYINFGEIDCDSNKLTCSEYHITGYPTTLLLFNGKLIANYRESRDSPTKIKQWILKQLNPSHLRDAEILTDHEIDIMTQIKKAWHDQQGNNPSNNRQKSQNKMRNNKNTGKFKIFPWEFNGFGDAYYYILGDVHPTVPFLIYLIGTLTGIIIGVGFVFCAAN